MSLEEGTTLTIITVLVAATTAIMTTVTVYFRKKQYDVTRSQVQLTGLMEVFHLLNNDTHRKARQIIYKHHRSRLNGEKTNEEEIHQEIAMVRSDFEMIGTFVKNNLLSSEVFLDAYWDTTISCWNALEENVMMERKLRRNSRYMANFEHLAGVAKEYKEKYAPDESIQPF
ncbi:MAG TPA: DUF4760 domain-containing protein [Nitrososphaera sp.]|nr:DUF4760 domain-containing protein [Nitrososphaera sp.]